MMKTVHKADKMSFVATQHSTRPYFPMLLANGRDAVLVNYSGSMMSGSPDHSHNEQYQGVLCAWYKIAHGGMRDENIRPIVQSGYHLLCNGEYYAVDCYEQSFDAAHAILTTKIGASGFSLVIETFISDESVLTEHYEIIDVPEGRNELEFFVSAPSPGLYPLILPAMSAKISKHKESGLIGYDYKIRGIAGSGFLLADRRPDKISADGISFSNLKPGDGITKYLLMLDETDHKPYKKIGLRTVEDLRTKTYKQNRSRHAATWEKFTGKSRISVPDCDLQYLYDLSIYVLKSHQHPATGCMTAGMFPPLWRGGGIFGYDSYYMQQAMLRTNHAPESGKLIDFWKLCSGKARGFAMDIKKPGMFFPWWSFTPLGVANVWPEEKRLFEKHLDTCVVPLEILRHYETAGDTRMLAAAWPLVEGCIDFLLAETVIELDDEAIVKTIQGANESTAVSNDSFTAIVTAKVLDMAISAAPSIGKKVPERYGVIMQKLRVGLARNYKDGVLMPFRGAQKPLCIPLMAAVWNLPECVDYKSVKASLEQTKTIWGLEAGMPTQKYKDWPWFHFRAAIASSFLKKGNALSHIYDGMKCNSALGAFPEKVRLDGYPIAYWYSSVHALFVFAVNSFLVNEADNRINILQHLPSTWKDVEFQNLRVPPGLLVSAGMKNGRLSLVEVMNDTERLIKATVSIPSRFLPGAPKSASILFPVSVSPGMKVDVINSQEMST